MTEIILKRNDGLAADRATWLLEQTDVDPHRLLPAVRAIVELYRDAKRAEATYSEMEWPANMAQRGDSEKNYARGAAFAYSRVIEQLRDAFAVEDSTVSNEERQR